MTTIREAKQMSEEAPEFRPAGSRSQRKVNKNEQPALRERVDALKEFAAIQA